ncbi:hypothetical protein ACG98H_03360 [Corynebacterium sp. L4756]|uniref:hypothetical protein n=1 Tax=unclassified Corynebacterium TaxID=2624378 RepID=UPI00374CA928
MNTSALDSLTEYEGALNEFKALSGGLFAGPTTPVSALKHQVRAIEGLETSQLVEQTRASTGTTSSNEDSSDGNTTGKKRFRGGRGFFVQLGFDFASSVLSGFAGGRVVNFFNGLFDDDDEDNQHCDDLNDQARRCQESIDDICKTSDQAIVSIILPTLKFVSVATSLLRFTPPGLLAGGLLTTVISLIEKTNLNIVDQCDERDKCIEECYREFEKCCDRVCDRELPCEPPEVEGCPEPEPPAGECTCEPPPTVIDPEPSEPGEPGNPSNPIKPKDPGNPSDPSHPVDPPVKKPIETTPTLPVDTDPGESKPQPKDPVVKYPNPEPQPEPKPEPQPKPEPAEECINEPVEEPCDVVVTEECKDAESAVNCTGILGALGVGVAIVGLGAFMMFIGEQLEVFAEVPEPQPEPEPESEPTPETEPEPKPEPEPKEPPEDLSKVPEPTPPPKKIFEATVGSAVASSTGSSGASSVGSSNGSTAVLSEPVIDDRAAESSATASADAGSQAGQGSSSPARKAGSW